MIYQILVLILLTFVPFIELRFSIPLGILSSRVELPFGIVFNGFGMNWLLVYVVCVATNALLGIVIYFLLDKFIHIFTRIGFIGNLYNKIIVKTQNKIHPYVEKYGLIGLALFIGMPIPGSGSYSGALGAYLLGIGYKKFAWVNFIGVVIAGTLVTIITLAGKGIFALF